MSSVGPLYFATNSKHISTRWRCCQDQSVKGTQQHLDLARYLFTIQWDRYRIFRSAPQVPGCYNGKIQSFYAESGPFPDHFWNFSGLLVVIFVAIVKKLGIVLKMVEKL